MKLFFRAKNNRPLPLVPSLWILWLIAFAYACVMALVIQKLVVPMMPSLNAGHGLMNADAIVFHNVASEMATRINGVGWSEWRLMPHSGMAGNVGLLAAVYSVFGPDPAWFIPINAAFHALGAILIFQLGRSFVPSKQGVFAGGIVAVLFLTFPSAVIWYGQNHKDAFLTAGYLMILLSFVRLIEHKSFLGILNDVLLLGIGCVLVGVMRPHMITLVLYACATAVLIMECLKIFGKRFVGGRVLRNCVFGIGVMLMLALFLPKNYEIIERPVESDQAAVSEKIHNSENSIDWHWNSATFIPSVVDRAFQKASYIRWHFITYSKSVGAGSIIDDHVIPENAYEMICYMPRALWVGLFAPFPNSWLDRPTVPRLLGALETLVQYLMALGIIGLLWRRPSAELVFCIVTSAFVIMVLSYSSPNVGTLHRIRYGPWFVFMLAGACGWSLILSKVNLAVGHAQKSLNDLSAETHSKGDNLKIGAVVSGKRAIGSGGLVTLISMISAMGLLIRDLLLIDRANFGPSLDSFYLAMMIPMLLVSIFSLPLGDAFTAALHRCDTNEKIQPLISAVSSLSLLFALVICSITFIFAGAFFRVFAPGSNVLQIEAIFPISLLLFLFSGLVVLGNSVLNSLGKQSVAAFAQLVVPVIATVAILLSPYQSLIRNAVAGMVIGQIVNLVIVFLYVSRQGFSLVPGRIIAMDTRSGHNYASLVASAILASLTIPLNYWLVGKLGVGAISTWAIGSKLVQIVTALGVSAMSAVLIPYFSKLVVGGLHLKVRGAVYLSLVAGSWGGALVALIVFVFTRTVVLLAMPTVQIEDPARVTQLVSVIQLGALQIPVVLAGLVFLKLSVISEASWKVIAANFAGLAVNAILGYVLLPLWGLFGVAAAWCVASLITTLIIMSVMRAELRLGWFECITIIVSWFVLYGAALGFVLNSSVLLASAALLFFAVVFLQTKLITKVRDVSELAIGR